MSLRLVFSTWMKSDLDLLTVADRVATFAARQTRWSDPAGDSDHGYVLMGLHTPEGRQGVVSHKPDEAVAQIQTQMARGGVAALVLSIGGSWQDPYVINQEVYQNWGASLLVHQAAPGSSLFPVDFHFREASFWFATRENADIFFDKDHTVWENSSLGYEMKEVAARPAWVPASYGKMYVAEEKIS